jgi:hypothetical protein
MRDYSRRSGELKNSFTEKWIKCMTFSIDPQTMHFFRLFRDGGLGLKPTHPSERTSSYYCIHYSGALRYAYLCVLL